MLSDGVKFINVINAAINKNAKNARMLILVSLEEFEHKTNEEATTTSNMTRATFFDLMEGWFFGVEVLLFILYFFDIKKKKN